MRLCISPRHEIFLGDKLVMCGLATAHPRPVQPDLPKSLVESFFVRPDRQEGTYNMWVPFAIIGVTKGSVCCPVRASQSERVRFMRYRDDRVLLGSWLAGKQPCLQRAPTGAFCYFGGNLIRQIY